MRARERRRRHRLVFAAAVVVFAAVNALFFFILFQPARSEYRQSRDSVDRLKREVLTRQRSIERLELLKVQLEKSKEDREDLFESRFLDRNTAFSRILPELDASAQSAGVFKSRVEYSIAKEPKFGLYAVKIGIPVQGNYANVVNFIRQLENTETFFILESIDLRNVPVQGATVVAPIALSLNLETFFAQ